MEPDDTTHAAVAAVVAVICASLAAGYSSAEVKELAFLVLAAAAIWVRARQ